MSNKLKMAIKIAASWRGLEYMGEIDAGYLVALDDAHTNLKSALAERDAALNELGEMIPRLEKAFSLEHDRAEKAEKEIQALKEQLAKAEVDTANERTEATVFETMHDNKVKELDVANEQLARMVETLERYLESGCDLHHEHGIREALSSYAPKWLKGVRAEAYQKGWHEAIKGANEALSGRPYKPNQSREKRDEK